MEVFCELRNGFDCVNHHVLMDTLQFFGIRKVVID